ncbi:MAG: nucleoside-diphosphate kinase [Acidobacteriia bacterium]|nr:nucleoside-diphosphate kinase [Terriglobia bacterium]
MSVERTFAMIKPDAVAGGHTGDIISIIEKAGFRVVALRKHHITRKQAEGFYAVHQARPFFGGLVKFMTEAPAIVMVLENENAIAAWRELMGATNPANAAEGTIRKKFATDIERNCVHGSDALETAAQEIPFFFSSSELL